MRDYLYGHIGDTSRYCPHGRVNLGGGYDQYFSIDHIDPLYINKLYTGMICFDSYPIKGELVEMRTSVKANNPTPDGLRCFIQTCYTMKWSIDRSKMRFFNIDFKVTK